MRYILCVLSLFVILMLVISGCTNNATQTVQKVVKPQGTVEPPISAGKSVLSTNPIPAPVQSNNSIESMTTLSYGMYYSGGPGTKVIFKNNITPTPSPTIIVIPSPTPIPNTTFVPDTPIPTSTPILTLTPTPTPIPNTTFVPDTPIPTSTPILTLTPTPAPIPNTTFVPDTPIPTSTPILTLTPTPAPIPNTTFVPDTPIPTSTPILTLTPTPVSTQITIVPTLVPGTVLSLSKYGIKADGSDETDKLNSAFDYAKSHNYKVIFFPIDGTIGLSSHVYSPANMELSGNGCTIKLLDNNDIGYGTCFFSIYENSYVHNLIFDGNMENQQVVTNGVGLYPNVKFEDNEVKNIGAYSLSLYRSDNVVINHNIIHDSLQYGIGTSGEGFPVVSDYANNITITNNTIYRCGQVGIKVRQTSNSLLKGNIITMPGKYDITGNDGYGSPEPTGIRLYTFDGANDHITITGNSITGVNGDNYEVGIESDDDENSNIVITNNQVKNAWIGIDINFNNGVITGNSISGCDRDIVNNGVGNIITIW